MKKNLILLMMLISTLSSYAQYFETYSDNQEIRNTMANNIRTLDPIEGVYYVEVIKKGWNNYRVFPDVIDNYYCAFYRTERPTSDYLFSAGRIGSTYYYNISLFLVDGNGRKEKFRKRIYLGGDGTFSFTLDLPVPVNMVGSRATWTYNFIKIYPTPDMYNQIR